ncbi:MAG: Maf family nucleotide pyrophosphatase [Bacteroidales bacterium]
MIADGLHDYDLILASASPRRKQLLEEAGFRFRTATIDYDEHWPGHLRGKEIAEFVAAAKSDAWTGAIGPGQIIITADTVVWCNETVLGKPRNDAEAMHFLRLLSACRHEVITGICLRDSAKSHLFSVTTGVTFRKLEEEEISYYVMNYRPHDKAGAYGIQEWIGLRAISLIEGSYYNVVGMPVSHLYDELLYFTGNKSKTI